MHVFIIYLSLITLLLFNYSCLHFPPTPAKPTSLPCFHPPPWLCLSVLYNSSWKPFSPLSLPPSPLAIVRVFLTSMSLVISGLLFSFVDYVPVIFQGDTVGELGTDDTAVLGCFRKQSCNGPAVAPWACHPNCASGFMEWGPQITGTLAQAAAWRPPTHDSF